MEHGMSNLWNKIRKVELANKWGICPYCPFHGGENSGRRVKRGVRKPKNKNMDRETIRLIREEE
jgi:hypothetical protein